MKVVVERSTLIYIYVRVSGLAEIRVRTEHPFLFLSVFIIREEVDERSLTDRYNHSTVLIIVHTKTCNKKHNIQICNL